MRTLKAQMRKFRKEIDNYAVQCKIKLSREILFRLIQATPVDTSQALSNWVVGLRAKNTKTRSAYYIGSEGSTQGLSSHAAYMQGAAIIANVRVGEVIYIANNLDYIDLLNEGLSAQAPDGFIQQVFETALARVKL